MVVDDGAALGWLRAYRHRVANEVQVVSGWLEMGDVDRARQALEHLRRLLEEEAALAAALPDPVAAFLIGQALLSEERGVRVRFQVAAAYPVPLPPEWPDLRQRLAETWARLEADLPRGGPQAELVVRLEGGVLHLEVAGARAEGVAVPLAGHPGEAGDGS